MGSPSFINILQKFVIVQNDIRQFHMFSKERFRLVPMSFEVSGFDPINAHKIKIDLSMSIFFLTVPKKLLDVLFIIKIPKQISLPM